MMDFCGFSQGKSSDLTWIPEIPYTMHPLKKSPIVTWFGTPSKPIVVAFKTPAIPSWGAMMIYWEIGFMSAAGPESAICEKERQEHRAATPATKPKENLGSERRGPFLSAPSPGDDLRSKSAIRLRGQNCTQRIFWGFHCKATYIEELQVVPTRLFRFEEANFFAVTIRLRLRCVLRGKMAKFASRCGNSLRFPLRFKASLAMVVAMPRCT